jgi:hypothetical protein
MFYLEYFIRQLVFCLSHPADIYYCCDPDTLMAPALICRFKKVKLVYDAHELFSEVPELLGQNLKKSIWLFVEKIGVKQASACITVSKPIADELSKRHRKNFHLIRNLPHVISKLDLLPRKNIILYQGVLNKGRGLEEAIANMYKLPAYELWICGRGDIENELVQIKERSMVSNVVFKGAMMKEELELLTKQAVFGLNLLDSASESYRLSLANKFFDYANAGVISINNRFPEYISYEARYHNCLLVDNFQEFVRTLDQLTEAKLKNLMENSRRMMLENNWEIEAEKLVGIIKSIN